MATGEMSINHHDFGSSIFSKLIAFGAVGLGGVVEVSRSPWVTPIISGLFAIAVALIYRDGTVRTARAKSDEQAKSSRELRDQHVDNLEATKTMLEDRCERQAISLVEKAHEIQRLTVLAGQCLAADPPKSGDGEA